MESPSTKSELVQLALKVEFISSFRSFSTSNIAGQKNQIPLCNVRESTKVEKCGRNNLDGSTFHVAKTCRDASREGQRQRDLSKTKCYNCGQIEYIKA